MMNNLSKIKKIISPLSVILISVGLIATLYLIALAATSYQVNSGATVDIDEWSTCQKVTNANAKALFVPTNTSAEWSAFRTNKPGDVTLASCITIPSDPIFTKNIIAGNSTIILNWTAPSSNGGSAITGYKIYRSTSSGAETLFTTLGNVLTYTNTGLTNGSPYYYKVSAVNAVGEGPLSGEVLSYAGSTRIFVTSTTYTGDLGGVDGADTKCQVRARAAGLGGTWKAWISSGATNITDASSRVFHNYFPYVNMLGIKVADDWTDLADGSLDAAINYNETGGTGGNGVWTGTYSDGTHYFSQDCSGAGAGWTVTTGTGGDAGLTGVLSSATGSWSNSGGTSSCNSSLPIYCFEQSTPICGASITDSRDSKVYPTVLIGDQCWMTKNMDYDNGCTLATWVNWQETVDWCGYYSGGPFANEGLLYRWKTAMGGSSSEPEASQGICPIGWHVPSDAELYTLENYLTDGGQTCNATRNNAWDCSAAGTKLKSGGSSGFNALMTGYRNGDGLYANRGTRTFPWSSTKFDAGNAWMRYLDSGEARTYRLWSGSGAAFPVRCVRDPAYIFSSSQSFAYTGTQQTFVVPAGITSITVDAVGAGSTYSKGGRAQGSITVTPGETIYIYVGGRGEYAAGGAASDIRRGGTALTNRVIVAGGGGGNGNGVGASAGGDGGGTMGISGSSVGSVAGGTGGTQVAGGTGGQFASNGGLGGGGSGALQQSGDAGEYGGDGGSGYYGGGGGGVGFYNNNWEGAGGGGGSSLVPAGGTTTAGYGAINSHGSVTLTW